LLFLQSFLTLLTLTREVLLLAPFGTPLASALLMESAENRLEEAASSGASGGLGSAYDAKLRSGGAPPGLEAYRLKGSGDSGMIGELPCR
jgi:hypothetical protein